MMQNPNMEALEEKKVITLMKVEPKAYFANERTLIQWVSTATVFGSIGVALAMSTVGDVAMVPACIATGLFVLVVCYILRVYFLRVRGLVNHTWTLKYADKRLVGTAVCALIFVNAFLLISSFVADGLLVNQEYFRKEATMLSSSSVSGSLDAIEAVDAEVWRLSVPVPSRVMSSGWTSVEKKFTQALATFAFVEEEMLQYEAPPMTSDWRQVTFDLACGAGLEYGEIASVRFRSWDSIDQSDMTLILRNSTRAPQLGAWVEARRRSSSSTSSNHAGELNNKKKRNQRGAKKEGRGGSMMISTSSSSVIMDDIDSNNKLRKNKNKKSTKKHGWLGAFVATDGGIIIQEEEEERDDINISVNEDDDDDNNNNDGNHQRGNKMKMLAVAGWTTETVQMEEVSCVKGRIPVAMSRILNNSAIANLPTTSAEAIAFMAQYTPTATAVLQPSIATLVHGPSNVSALVWPALFATNNGFVAVQQHEGDKTANLILEVKRDKIDTSSVIFADGVLLAAEMADILTSRPHWSEQCYGLAPQRTGSPAMATLLGFVMGIVVILCAIGLTSKLAGQGIHGTWNQW